MCGLVVLMDSAGTPDKQRVSSALEAIRHRGPDGEDIVSIDSRILMGFCRLSILDLSHAADQPMRAPDDNIIVFNGEIYNFLELRAELETLGHHFRTQGDTEVVLAAYAQWGEAAFTRLNGMWAIVLYEAATGDLIACRDRMGVKPLLYASNGAQQALASEVRALLKALALVPKVNDAMVFDFLAGIELDHTEMTMFEGIISVPAGGLWRIHSNGMVTRKRYHTWDTTTVSTATDPESAATLRALLTDSVRLRLRSDAPTVSLLSGGLDSSLITWLSATVGQHEARTKFRGAFSYGYDDERYAEHDEIERARALVAALPEPIEHYVVKLDPVPTLDELLELTATQEQPCTTPSIIASWRLYQRIRAEGVKVVVSGEGADELFAGYTRRYLPMLVRDHLARGQCMKALALLRSPYVSLAGVLKLLTWHLPESLLVTLLKRLRPNVVTINPSFWRAQSSRLRALLAHHRMPLQQRLADGITHIEMPQILRYTDRNSMHASVEARIPFMDYRLVQFALSLNLNAKISVAGGKQLLRIAFADILPARVLQQPKTHGFGNAEQHLVQAMPLMELLARAPLQAWDYLDKATLQRELTRRQTHPMVWLPISFLLWMTAWHEQKI